jgi:uncharacterized protein
VSWIDAVSMGLVAVITAYALLALGIAFNQRSLIYKPDPRRITPVEAGHVGVEVWQISTPDGETLTAWYAAARPGRPTLLYFHGNAGWVELRSERLTELTDRGYGVLMPSMRGYGGSTGQASETAAVADALLVYDALRDSGIEASTIILFGESLGTGIATQLAAARTVSGLVLDSPYTGMVDLAQLRYPWLPVRLLLADRYETVKHIKSLNAPLLILHGEADMLVPIAMGQAIHAAAPLPKVLLTYPDAPHLEHVRLGSFHDLDRWIATLRAADCADSVVHKENARG